MPAGKCLGRNSEEHCCWWGGKPCPFLEENTEPGFRWSCGLRRELGSWDAVINDPRYIEGPATVFAPLGMNCRDFPGTLDYCTICKQGRGAEFKAECPKPPKFSESIPLRGPLRKD